jgi:polyferredoxin
MNPLPAPLSPARNAAPKSFLRRATPDRFQRTRRIVQYAFVALNAWLGLQFYLWVLYYERGGVGLRVPRPAGAEGWLPIAGLMNFKLFLSTGTIPSIHPAALILFMAFVAISLLLKKSFCSWLCPIGTLSEHLARIGRRLFGRNLRLPRGIDIPLRALKYLLLAFFVLIIGGMSASMLSQFLATPYGLIADVKMLNFFRHMGPTALIVVATLVLLSVLVENLWCRYLCPYGALMGLVSLLSPLKIRRDPQACTRCGACARACPAALPVDQLVQVRSAECTACLQCVSSCPVEGALVFSLPNANPATQPNTNPATQPNANPSPTPRPRYRQPVTPLAFVALLAFLFFAFILTARATDHWQTRLPDALYLQLIPAASQLSHPGLH